METTMTSGIVFIILVSFVLNVLLGIWRANTKKFSVHWFLAIHLAVPIIYYLRVSSGLPSWNIPVLIGFAVMGQLVGGFVNTKYNKRDPYSMISEM